MSRRGRVLPSLPLALAIARYFGTPVESIFLDDEPHERPVRVDPIRRYPTMPDEQELFVIDYPARQPQEVWMALKRALATMDLQDPDDEAMTARFSTGVSLTSWGEHMLATVSGSADGGARITVRGRPKGSFLTTQLGEDLHAREVEKDLRRSIDDALAQVG
jgi:hypothetical protein